MTILRMDVQTAYRKTFLYAVGIVLILLAVAALNISIYMALSESFGYDVGALIVSILNAVLAVVIIVIAGRTKPGPEADMAKEIRDYALAEINADLDKADQNIDEFKTDVQRIRSGFNSLIGKGGASSAGFMSLTTALGPLLDLLIGWLQKSKKKGKTMSDEDTRQEIEDLRARLDELTSDREKSETSEPLPAKPAAPDSAEESGVSDDSADRVEVAEPPRAPVADDPRAPAAGKFVLPPSGQIMPAVVILAATLALLVVGRDFLVPLAVAILFWNLLNALASAFGRIQFGKSTMHGWLAWTLSLIVLALANWVVYWILTSQSEALIAAAPVYEANFVKLSDKFATLLGIERMPSTEQLMESVNLGALLSWLGGSVGSLLAELVLVFLYVAFLLAEQRHFPEKITRLVTDEEKATEARILMSQISKQVQTYIWIKTVVSLITGFVSYIVLRLIGVDFAAVWALIIFLLNFIPNIGSALGVIFPALLALVQFETLTPFVMVVLGLGATQFIIGNIVEPAMMGSSLNLSSFVIILSLTFWGMIWGIAGMILCVPITVIVAIICTHFKRLHWLAILLSSDGRINVPQEET